MDADTPDRPAASVPDSLRLRRLERGPRRAMVLAFDGPTPLVAYALPVAVVAIVAGVAAVAASADVLAVANGTIAPVRAGTALGATLAVGIALVIAHGFGTVAATLALAARASERPLGLRSALVGAARRPLAIVAVAIATIGVVAAATVVRVLPGAAPVITAVVAFVAFAVAAPLLLAWPRVVADRRPLGASLAWAWRARTSDGRLLAEPLGGPRRAILLTLLLVVAVGVGVARLADLVPHGWWSPAVPIAVGLVPAAVGHVLLVAVLARGAAVAEAALDGYPSGNLRARAPWLLPGVAVLLAPAVVASGLVWANPFGVPTFAAGDVGRVWCSSSIATWDGGTAVVSQLGGLESDLMLCDGASCAAPVRMPSGFPSTIASASDGGLLIATWVPVGDEESYDGRLELRVQHAAPDEIVAWQAEAVVADEERRPAGLPGEPRTLGGRDLTFDRRGEVSHTSTHDLMAVAIDSSGDQPVVASIVRPEGSKDAVLAVDACADARCAASERTEVPLRWGDWQPNVATLDVALTADGTAVVTLADGVRPDDVGVEGASSPLRVVSVRDGEATVVDLDQPGHGDASSLDDSHGAQIEIGADGLPLILARGWRDTTLRLLDCADATCADTTAIDVDPLDGVVLDGIDAEHVQHSPAFTIDASGRPIIGAIDATGAVTLRSCDDVACSSLTTTTLVDGGYWYFGLPGGFALTLDADEHLHVAVGARRPAAETPSGWAGTILECSDARCSTG